MTFSKVIVIARTPTLGAAAIVEYLLPSNVQYPPVLTEHTMDKDTIGLVDKVFLIVGEIYIPSWLKERFKKSIVIRVPEV